MVKVNKRRKNSRIRGARTCGWGFRQKHKGHGNRGGVGMAGSGKRADHKKQKAVASDKKANYFGRRGITSRGSLRKKVFALNLRDIKDNFFKKEGDKINLSKYKILSVGEGFRAEINAKAASPAAIEKMKKAGGMIILPIKKEKKVAEKEDKVEEEKKE